MADKKVLLYSGGMDSVILDRMVKPDVRLYFDIGGRYTKSEMQSLGESGKTITLDVTLDLSGQERADAIIPFRNALFVIRAATYGNQIYLGSTLGDRSCDKDVTFAILSEEYLNHMNESHWGRADWHYTVHCPMKGMTKAECVAWFLKDGGESAELLGSFSCYSPTKGGLHCGNCKPCVRKYMALDVNGIYANGIFAMLPTKSDYFRAEYKAALTGARGRESEQFVKYYEKRKGGPGSCTR